MKNKVSEKVLIQIEGTITLDLLCAINGLKTTIDSALKLCKTDEELKQFIKDNNADYSLNWIKDSQEKISTLLDLIK
jgi:hypothetical protein